MGVTDQAGDIVKSITDSFKDNPACLAAILLAAMFSVLTYFNMQQEAERSQQRYMQVVGLCWNTNTSGAPRAAPPLQ
jgi:hypothetical protein